MKHNMKEEIICAGFGGQGIMVMGKLLAHVGMDIGHNVTWMPSYGAEVRGGTAHSMIVVSDEEIASPKVNNPSVAVVMNKPSFDKFHDKVIKDGVLLINSSLIEEDLGYLDINVVKIPATETASGLGNIRVSNMVMIGALIAIKEIFKIDDFLRCIKEIIPVRRHNLIPINEKAIRKGIELANNQNLKI